MTRDTGGDQELAGVVGADAFKLEQARRELVDERLDEVVEFGDLVVELKQPGGQ